MIRDAREADLPALRAIQRAAYAPFVGPIGREPAPMAADLASTLGDTRIDGEGLGFCVSYADAGGWHVENLAVHPSAQGQGLGRALLADAEARAVATGAGRVHLYTNALMADALRLYPLAGYAETGRRHEDGFDRVFFAKRL